MTDEDQRAIDEARAIVLAEQKIRALERLRQSVVSERRWWRIVIVAAMVLGVVGLVLSLEAGKTADKARDALDEFKASRQDALVVSCQADNDTAKRINGLNDRTQGLLRDATTTTGRKRTPEEQARIDAFLKDQLARYEALKVPLRVCTPEAIADYYAGRS